MAMTRQCGSEKQDKFSASAMVRSLILHETDDVLDATPADAIGGFISS
jgi:hypothetical protein